MTAQDETIEKLRHRREEIRNLLAEVGDFRPYTLSENYRRCGKASCHCAAEDSPGHGPYWLLTRKVENKTVTRIVPRTAIEQTRAQVEEYKRYRQLSREFIEASERLCHAQLVSDNAESDAKAAKKKGSKRHLERR